jgi:hypothetical protein
MAPPKKTPTKRAAPDEASTPKGDNQETPRERNETPSGKKASRTPKRDWNFTHIPNSTSSANGRQEGRILIPWTRKLACLPYGGAPFDSFGCCLVLMMPRRARSSHGREIALVHLLRMRPVQE